ncbi:MAG: ATP-dependent zinc metalloprotease FtsH [Phycisphaerae bacterium]
MPEKPPRGPTPPQPPNRFGRSLMGWAIGIGLVIMAFMMLSRGVMGGGARELPVNEFWAYLEQGKIVGTNKEPLIIRERRIEGWLAPKISGERPDESRKFYVSFSYQAEQDFDKELRSAIAKSGTQVAYKYEPSGWWESLLPQLLLAILLFGVVWFFLFRRIGAAGGGGGFLGGFGRSRHRLITKEQSRITFSDVAGIEEAKEEVREIIEFLKNPRKFQRLGGRVPRGVLLVGEPGCGKTLLAKAIAGEAEVPFFSISGSDFVEMFVGVGASRVRDLFKQAKDSAPCIVFLDEIDAVGRRRGVGFNGGGHDEREQTLNAILVEMDGFDSSDQVIVIAATNRADVLDPALVRPGRFDRQINVPLPDLKGRYEILKIYINKVKCGPDVDINRLARGTPMFSGADLAALVNEAAIAATMSNKDAIEQADLEEARDKVRWGRARKSRVVDEKEKEIAAYHEAGHTLTQVLTPGSDPVHKVSIIPRGMAGGATILLPEKDRHIYTLSFCKGMLRMLLGGRLAEQIFCNDVSSGASNDLQHATELARRMVMDWGMSDKLGVVSYSPEERRMMMPEFAAKDYSDKTAELLDQEIKRFIDEAYTETRQLLESNRETLKRLAEALLKYETLSGEEVKLIVDGQMLDKPTVGDLLDREHSKTARAGTGVTLSPPVPGPGPLAQPG